MDARLLPSWIGLVCLLVAACGGTSAPTPTAPTSPASPLSPTSPVVPPGTETPPQSGIRGRVTDAVRGEGIGEVTVTLDRAGTATTDASGQFVIDSGAKSGIYRTALSGGGILARQTTVALQPTPIALTAIPTSFNTVAFDEFARSLAGGVLIRWNTPPALVVESSKVTSPSNQNVALDDRIPSVEVERVITRLAQALPQLTGGRFSAFASVTRQTTPAGREIPMYTNGAVTVVYYTERNGACGQAGPIVSLPSYAIRAGAVWLRDGCATLNNTTMVHELGHALGYGHVTGALSVMRPTGGVDITEFDRSAATIVFDRPSGNRAPDTDPDDFVIGSSSARFAAGVLVIPPVP